MKRTLLALCASAVAATAAEYTVTSNADDGEGSLRALCTAAVSGDTIYIPGGMTITLDSVIDLKSSGKGLAIVGIGDGDDRPVITCNDSHRAFFIGRHQIPGTNPAAFFRHEFRNLIFRDITSADNGAAIYLGDYAPAGNLISNCLFEACTAPQGAAVRLDRSDAETLVQDCVFRGCASNEGYAFYVQGKLRMERCVFDGNTSSPAKVGNVAGAAAKCNGTYWLMEDCLFTNNVSGGNGGAIDIPGGSNIFTRCDFIGNSAPNSTGGAIYGRNAYTLRDCRLIDNWANDGGGAIFRYNGRIEFYNCLFQGNSTKGASNWQGGAAFFSRDDGESGGIISNCVFRGNYNMEKNGTGGAVYGYGSKGHTTIVDTLFEGNRALGNSGALKITRSTDVRNCTFSENYCYNGVSAVWAGTGDISEERPDVMAPRPVLFENCTFYGNTTDVHRAVLWIENSKTAQKFNFDENDVYIPDLKAYQTANPGVPTYEKSFANSVDHVTIRHCTFAENVLGQNYGALLVNNSGSTATSRVDVVASVFHNNTFTDAKGTVNYKDINGSIQTLNYTSLDQAANGFTIRDPENSANNWFGGELGDLKFDSALSTNGTEKVFLDGTRLPTLALAASSPLRNKAPLALALDARGVERGVVDGCADLGAYEYLPFLPTVLLLK